MYDHDDDGNASQTSEITLDSLFTDDMTIGDITLDSFDFLQSTGRRASRKVGRQQKKEKVPLILENEIPEMVGLDVTTLKRTSSSKAIDQYEYYYNNLVGFYKVKQPRKLDNIKNLLEMWKDNEMKLKSLVKKVEAEYNVSLMPSSRSVETISSSAKSTQRVRKQRKVLSSSTKRPAPAKTDFIDSFQKLSFETKMTLMKKKGGSGKAHHVPKGNVKNFINCLDNVNKSAQSFLNQQSSKYEKYLLDKDYHRKKRFVSAE